MRTELERLHSMWKMCERVHDWKKFWMSTYWLTIDTRKVFQSGTELENALAQFPEACQHWDIAQSLLEAITSIKTALPLVEDLSNSAMRTRHWKQLTRETKSAIQIDQDTVRYMTLAKLLNSHIHGKLIPRFFGPGYCQLIYVLNLVYSEDVKKIVSRAKSDLTIEQLLKKFEEIWLSKVFVLKIYVNTSSEPQFGALEVAGNENVRETFFWLF